MAEPLLRVQNLVVETRAAGRPVPLLRGLDLELAAGQAMGLVGESGAGKSLTGLALMGLVPTGLRVAGASRIGWRGRDLAGLGQREWRPLRGSELALIPQHPMTALNPTRTVGSQMRYLLRLHQGRDRHSASAEAAAALARTGLPEADRVLELYPHQLSGGMSQRVLIAMAMLNRPRLLIADEVTSALDVTTQAAILDQLTGLCRDSGTALLLITHDLGIVARSCRTVAVMYCGQIVEQGPLEAVFARPRHPYTAGLLAAVPGRIDPPDGRLHSIAGQVPDSDRRPPGCPFAPRCARATRRCAEHEPDRVAEQDRLFRCIHPLD